MRLQQTYTIHAPVSKVWQALTDATVIDHWNTAPAEMNPKVGGAFSIYDGDIHGITTELIPEKLLRQDWYGMRRPDQKYAVSFTLAAEADGTTKVTVSHDVGENDLSAMRDIWSDYYFNPMKQLLEKQASDRARLKLVGKENVVGNVWSFYFTSTKPLTWIAGQYIWVELLHKNPDAEGMRRWFTIASAPYEGQVQITTRISSSTFKQALAALPIGGELELLERPDGDFIWHDSELPIVFVAGGIGITAFHSILKERVYENALVPVTLLYANRDEAIPFKQELQDWHAHHPELAVRYITGPQLTAAGLIALQPNLLNSLVYISGPEGMVTAIGDALLARGLPQTQLRLDALPNYTQQNY